MSRKERIADSVKAEVLELHKQGDLKEREIAEKCGISQASVNRIIKASKSIKAPCKNIDGIAMNRVLINMIYSNYKGAEILETTAKANETLVIFTDGQKQYVICFKEVVKT